MTTHWTTEHINTLAPDNGSLKNGRALAVVSKWQTLGQADGILWGEIKGSGSNPYQTCIEQSTPTFKCSCPSRKFPCKHGLGLAFIFTTQPDALNQTEFPAWVAEWVNKREQRTQKQNPKVSATTVNEATLKKREQAQQKRYEARDDKVSTGVSELQTWLYDQVRQSLSQSVMDHRPWEKMAARMIDAQAPALAQQLQHCSEIRFAGGVWQEKLLRKVARLHLLLFAYQQRKSLSPDLQADVAMHIGITSNKVELLERNGITDDWLVIGQALEERESMRTQRTWLYGIEKGRYALLLDFAIANQAMTLRPLVGSYFNAEVVFYANTWTVRALIKQEYDSVAVAPEISVFISIESGLHAFQTQLAQSPWLSSYPFALSKVVPVYQNEHWLLIDNRRKVLPLRITESQGWHLLAVSGGQAVNIFGEWDGEYLLPLTVFTDAVERL